MYLLTIVEEGIFINGIVEGVFFVEAQGLIVNQDIGSVFQEIYA